MKLEVYGGMAYKWALKMLPQVVKWWEDFGGDGTPVIRSRHACNSEALMALEFSERCLSFNGVSTACVLAGLVKWGYLNRASGGFEDVVNRQAAACVLESMIASMHSHNQVRICVTFDEEWKCQWPRPPVSNCSTYTFTIDTAGKVDWGEFTKFAVARAYTSVCRQWYQAVQRSGLAPLIGLVSI